MAISEETRLTKELINETPFWGNRIKKLAQEGWDSDRHTEEENGVAFRLGLPNLLDTDNVCRDDLCELVRQYRFRCQNIQQTICYDLVSFGIHCANWSGIVNELRGYGITTKDFKGDITPTEYQQSRPTGIVIDELDNDQRAESQVRALIAVASTPEDAATAIRAYIIDPVKIGYWIQVNSKIGAFLVAMLDRVDWLRVVRALTPEQ